MRLLLSFFWNWWVKFHIPVTYQAQFVNKEVFKRKDGDYFHVIEVSQFKYSRVPRPPFLGRAVYQYEVTQCIFKDKHLVTKTTRVMPEYSSILFRNTRVPYVLAVNAFLELIEGECNG